MDNIEVEQFMDEILECMKEQDFYSLDSVMTLLYENDKEFEYILKSYKINYEENCEVLK